MEFSVELGTIELNETVRLVLDAEAYPLPASELQVHIGSVCPPGYKIVLKFLKVLLILVRNKLGTQAPASRA